jgi:SAM-dependent methyltransferase
LTEDQSIWEQPERVEQFASREADARLMAIVETIEDAAGTRVLDLGCAGGRNAVALAQLGLDVYALDSSLAMVAKTRDRVAAIIGEQAAAQRVLCGRMEDLSGFEAGFFHLVVALGVYHNARNRDQWDRSLAETARVLYRDGRVLVANFTPRTDPEGSGMQPVEDESHVYIGFGVERLFLLEADDLDAEMSRHGLDPIVPSETVTKTTDSGRRVTVNALYQKRRA